MARSERLRLRDLRDVYRLIGECSEVGSDPQAWRSRLLDGLRQLVGAQVGLYMHFHDVGEADERIAAPLDAGFLDADGRALWAHYQHEKAHRDDPFHQRYYGDFTGRLRTRTLESVVDPQTWRQSRHYNDYVRACGLDDRITSSLRLPDTTDSASTLQVIVLHRAAADGQYDRRAPRLVRLLHHEIAPLLGRQLAMTDPAGQAPLDDLPLRLQQVLAGLMRGEGEKQIAARLGISRHTVNRHVQRLYDRFGVHSRGELTFRCRDMLSKLEEYT